MIERITLSEKIRRLSDSIGIDALGFAETFEFTNYAITHSKRRDPKQSLRDAKTIIVAGFYIGGLTLPAWTNHWYGRTSRLYSSGFFLDVVHPLAPIVNLLRDEGYKAVVCDGSSTERSILPLRLAAIRAGLGWQGKHSLIISKNYGTFLAFGGIITNAELEYNSEEKTNNCHKCDICQRTCPLGALEQSYMLNIKKCLSYLLQVHHLPQKAQTVMENRVGDCEMCQDVCPWNKKHLNRPLSTILTISFQEKTKIWENIFYLPNLVQLTNTRYKEIFGHRNTGIPYQVFHRNVAVALERAKNL